MVVLARPVEEPERNAWTKRGINRSILDQGRGIFAAVLNDKRVERKRPFVEL